MTRGRLIHYQKWPSGSREEKRKLVPGLDAVHEVVEGVFIVFQLQQHPRERPLLIELGRSSEHGVGKALEPMRYHLPRGILLAVLRPAIGRDVRRRWHCCEDGGDNRCKDQALHAGMLAGQRGTVKHSTT